MVMENPCNPCNPWLTSVAAWPRCALRVSAVKGAARKESPPAKELPLRPSAFGFRPSFGLRPSTFGFPAPPAFSSLRSNGPLEKNRRPRKNSPLRISAFGFRPSFGLRPSAFDLRPSTFGLRPSAFGFPASAGHCRTEQRKHQWFSNPKGIAEAAVFPSSRSALAAHGISERHWG